VETLAWIIAGGALMSAIALVGVVTFFLSEAARERLILPLVAFSAGSLLGGAFFHLMPESLGSGGGAMSAFTWMLLGFSLFFALEQFLHWHHWHHAEEGSPSPLTLLLVAGDGVHNFLGGMAVAGAFLVDIRLGITTWIAAAAHEVPQELGKFGVLLHGGWSRGRALMVSVASSLTFLIGGLLTYAASFNFDTAFLVPFAAGNFLYIGASDLIPEVNKHHRLSTALLHFTSFGSGVVLLYVLKLTLDTH
jgi:zinc and cadmium transporter